MRAFFFLPGVARLPLHTTHRNPIMPCFCLTHKQDDFNKISELQVCIAEALYDAEAVLSNPSAFKAEEIRTLRDQITSNLERAWAITGMSADQLTGIIVQISQAVAKQFKTADKPPPPRTGKQDFTGAFPRWRLAQALPR